MIQRIASMISRRRSVITLLLGLAVFAGTFSLRGLISRQVNSVAQAGAGLEACRALIAGFQDYPLVYVGEKFEGLPLTTCMRNQTSGTSYGIPPTDQVIFIYGTCTLDFSVPDPSCAPPIQIHVYPSCMPTPVVAVSSGQTRRGVDTAFLNRGSSVIADASRYRVKISAAVGDTAANQALALRAFDALRGANPLAAGIGGGSPLTALGNAPQPAAPCR